MEASIGPYRLLRKISRGGMGSVYEAIHSTIERRVAIKVLDVSASRGGDMGTRFLNEARAVNRVNDPGLVQMFDHGQLRDGTAYIVMEFLEGETLSRRLRRLGRRMPIQDILRLLQQTAETLRATHDKGIIHRDLKPDNIMIVRDPAVAGGERTKILDFGIAKLRESVPTKGTNTHKDLLMGTPSYMSPEQCKGAGGVDEKTDVYSLGVVLYRALAGRPPFVAVGAGDTMAQHIYQEPPALSEQAAWLPANLTGLVHRMLRKDKDQRPSMTEVATELGQLAVEHRDFVLPELPEDVSQSGLRQSDAGIDELSQPSEGGEDDEDSALETIAVSESAVSLHPAVPAAALSAQSQSAPSLLGWSVSNTGQAQGETRRRRDWLAIGAALVIVVLGGGILAARFGAAPHAGTVAPISGSPTPAPVVVAPPIAPPPAAAPALVVWKLETSPAGAEVVRVSDGQVLGRTPWHSEVPSGGGVEELRLRLAGHVERLVSLQRNANSHSSVELMPIASPPAPSGTVDPKQQGLSQNSSQNSGQNSSQNSRKNSGKNPKRGHVKIVLED